MTINTLKDRIYESKRLTKQQKESATEDLDWMEVSKLYALYVDYDPEKHYYTDIFDMFTLSKSILGFDFWKTIIYNI